MQNAPGGVPEARLAARTRVAAGAVARLCGESMVGRRPADRALEAYLRANRRHGSHDRRFIASAFYSILRWWGWLERLCPAGLPAEHDLAENGWVRLMLAGLVCEGVEDDDQQDMARFMAASCGLGAEAFGRIAAEPDRLRRAPAVIEALGGGTDKLSLRQLVPSWTAAQINCPRPIDELVQWLQKRPPLWLRIQRGEPAAAVSALDALDLHPASHERIRHAVNIRSAGVNLQTVGLYRDGTVEVQDLASQAVGRVCDPGAGERWWDACAGGGGKSLLLAQLMGGAGTVTASDVRTGKLAELRSRARRAGFRNITVSAWDGAAKRLPPGSFDGVLVDAPCSGSGTWRRNPAARWIMVESDIDAHVERQLAILRDAAAAVRRGGSLVYATCSMFERENGGVVREFLSQSREFALEPFDHPLTGIPCDGMARIWPWEGDCDAMFAARMRRQPLNPC